MSLQVAHESSASAPPPAYSEIFLDVPDLASSEPAAGNDNDAAQSVDQETAHPDAVRSTGSLDLNDPALHVIVEPHTLVLLTPKGRFSIPTNLLSDSLLRDPFFSIIHTAHEINIIASDYSSAKWVDVVKDVGSLAPPSRWKALKIRGPLDLSMVGVMAQFSKVLQDAGVSIFVISTHLTDYVLVDVKNVERAVAALGAAGWQFD